MYESEKAWCTQGVTRKLVDATQTVEGSPYKFFSMEFSQYSPRIRTHTKDMEIFLAERKIAQLMIPAE